MFQPLYSWEHIPQRIESKDSKTDRCTPVFIAVLITIAKMEPLKSVNRWIKKMWNIYVKRNIIHF